MVIKAAKRMMKPGTKLCKMNPTTPVVEIGATKDGSIASQGAELAHKNLECP